MKRSLLTLAVAGLSLLFVSQALAADITVNFPQGSVSAKATKIIAQYPWDGTADTWGTPGPLGNIAFGQLAELTDTLGAGLGIWGPSDKSYYAIDIGLSGGAVPVPFPSVSVSFSGDAVLLDRIATTYKVLTYGTAEPAGTSQFASDAVPAFVSEQASYQGHWVRIYLGINTDYTDGATHLFTSANTAGDYSATLTISIT